MVKIISTLDGSQSLLDERNGETYHSKNGAVQESMHIFIQAGLREKDNLSSVNIFEMGFGTGLNALLTIVQNNKKQAINYYSVEAYPVSASVLDNLNYAQLSKQNNLYKAIVEQPYGVWKHYNNVNLFKHHADFLTATFQPGFFDIIYYDAFSPEVQPELWTVEAMEKCYGLLKQNGILTTYCAKGQFKRNLKSVGFVVQALPGPPGKREIVRAIKS